MKSLAAFGLVGVATASVIVPASGQASGPQPVSSASGSSAVAAARLDSLTVASRSTARLGVADAEASAPTVASGPTAGAVAAPAAVTPETVAEVGVSGFSAVAKPATQTNLDKMATSEVTAGANGGTTASVTQVSPGAAVPTGAGYSASAYASWCSGLGLGASGSAVCSAARSLFGITNIGGFRAGDSGDHGAGMAVDIMVGDFGTGDSVAAFFQEHAGEFRIKYLIWKQRYWAPGGGWSMMEDRGSPTQNHYDHVHVSVY